MFGFAKEPAAGRRQQREEEESVGTGAAPARVEEKGKGKAERRRAAGRPAPGTSLAGSSRRGVVQGVDAPPPKPPSRPSLRPLLGPAAPRGGLGSLYLQKEVETCVLEVHLRD